MIYVYHKWLLLICIICSHRELSEDEYELFISVCEELNLPLQHPVSVQIKKKASEVFQPMG